VKKLLVLAVCVVFVLTSMTALAASKNGVITSANGRQTIAPRAKNFTPYVEKDSGLSVIASNVATKYPLGMYWCCTGGTISGPLSIIGTEYWEAAGFTPAANATVKKVGVAVGYVTGATTDVVLTLNADAGGVPGKVLAKWKVSGMPNFGSCCTLDTKKSSGGVSVTAGTLYWLAVTTESNSDIWAAFNLNDSDQVDPGPTAYAQNGAWTGYQGIPAFSFEVLGN